MPVPALSCSAMAVASSSLMVLMDNSQVIDEGFEAIEREMEKKSVKIQVIKDQKDVLSYSR